jgi:phosphatidylglycerol:prolipoprotein diacylglycerol transferase
MLAITFPNFDPIAFTIFGFPIRWYGLAYIAGILLGYQLLYYLNKKLATPIITKQQQEDIIFWAVLGIIIGGRLGYVLFYDFSSYVNNPMDIPKLWLGGMSFHGGMLGLITAIYLFCRIKKLNFWPLIDLIACVAPLGIFLGRIANFINGELVGRQTNVAWAVIFPAYDHLPRHPSQLYEAASEGILLFLIMMFCFFKTPLRQYPSKLAGMFLFCYGLMRIVVENFREPDINIGYWLGVFTTGQVLCLPMVLIGLYLLFFNRLNYLVSR